MTRSILCTLLIMIISCGNALSRPTAVAGNPEETEAEVMAALRQFQEENWYLSINSRLIIYQEAMGNKILALFLGL